MRARLFVLFGCAGLFLLACKGWPPIIITIPSPPPPSPSPFACAPGSHYQHFSPENGGPKCVADAIPSPSPVEKLCPAGERWVWEAGGANGYCEPIPPPTPRPCPVGQHLVTQDILPLRTICVPDASPSPSPDASPAAECKTPQLTHESWEVANFGCLPGVCPNPSAVYGDGPLKGQPVPASAVLDPIGGLTFPLFDFIGEHGIVVKTIEEVSGCAWKQNPCPTGMGYQQAHALIAAKLRAKGFCAGQHVDGGSDMITVSTNPPFRGLWLEVHQICGDDSGANGRWCWGKIEQSGTLWRVIGTGVALPSPDPDASPSPVPSPSPTVAPSGPPPGPGVPTIKIASSAASLRIGQSARITCTGKPGAKIAWAAELKRNVWINGRTPFTTPIPPGMKRGSYGNTFCLGYGNDFVGDHDGFEVRILNGSADSPLHRFGSCALTIYCYVPESSDASRNLRIQVSK